MKKLFLLFVLMLISLAADAEVVIYGIAYNLDSDAKTAEVTKGNYEGDIVIPEQVEYDNTTYRVTSIGEEAFYLCEGLKNILLPNGITSIGKNAFLYCRGLSSITIPESVTSIGAYAFCNCQGLKTINLPAGLSKIEEAVFLYCYSLSDIVIPNNVKIIGHVAFEGCSCLQSILIPKSVEVIEERAFSNCDKLESMVVERDNPKYDSRDNCNAIIETASNTLISGCKNTVIPNSITSIGSYAFMYCYTLSSISIPESVTFIGEYAFLSCSSLTSITIPQGVTSIESCTFQHCENLKTIELPENLSEIGVCAFYGCHNLSDIIIPANVTFIRRYAFEDCKSLQSIVIPKRVETIEEDAFIGCSDLESIVVESGNPNYDSRDNCNALIETASNTLIIGCKNTTIPNGITAIRNSAFSGCSGLSAISIPNSVRSIGDNAFSGCSGLVSVTACNALNINSNVFDQETYENATLYVPRGKGVVFKGDLIWGKFSKMVEIEMPGVDINDNPFDNLYDKRLILSHSNREDGGGSGGGTPDDDIVQAVMFPTERMMRLKGCQITHVRFCLWHTDFNNMKVWIGTAKDKRDLALQDLTDLHEGWNVVKLEHPYTITGETIYVGFDCHDNQMTYPVKWDAYEKTDEGTRVYFREGKWSTGTGTWYIQCMVEGENVPKYDLHITEFTGPLHKKVIKAGDTYYCKLLVRNWGSMPIEQHEWKPMIDGEIADYEFTYGKENIAVGGGTQELRVGIRTGKDLSVGCKKLTIVPKTLNGEEYDSPEKPKELTMRIYEHDMGKQKVLVQVYTGTWCGHCPEFDEFVEKKMQERDDFVLLSIHCDDVYSTEADNSYELLLYTDGIPNVDLDRCVWFNTYNQREYVMDYQLDDAKGQPSFANINIAASYEGWSRRVDITISGDRNEDFIPVEGWTNMTVLLVEDRVEGGQMGTNKYPYYHNGVIRANLSDIWGDLVEWNGDHYEMHYTAELDKAWNKDNMRIVAFFSKPFTGDNYDVINVMNCEEMGLKDAETGIQSPLSDKKTPDVFDLNGRKVRSGNASLDGLPKGVYIVNGKKVVK